MHVLHLVIKIHENGKNKVFRGKEAPNKVQLLFLDMKMVEEKFDRRF